MIFQNDITLLAQKLYPEIYQDTSKLQLLDKDKIQIGDSCADQLCKRWQEKAISLFPALIAEAKSRRRDCLRVEVFAEKCEA